MEISLSVVICTHNPRPAYLERTLAALRKQTLDPGQWELILVDNASTQPLLETWDLGWHPHHQHLREEALGLTPARLCGMRKATGNLLVLVDDDNLLDPEFLETALRIARERPEIGAFGGQIRPEFESEPPGWTRAYWELLAIREFSNDLWANFPAVNCAPCGAGMCLRRAVAQRYMEVLVNDPRRRALDRTGNALVSYGDIDLAWCACDIGLGAGRFTALILTHLIPARRLEKSYLLELAEAVHYSSDMLEFSREGRRPRWSPRTRLIEAVRTWRLPALAAEFRRAATRGRARAASTLATVGDS